MDEPLKYKPDTELKLLSREMVHSLNNMLFVISSYSQFIKETHTDEETLMNLKRIEVSCDQCQKIMKEWRAKADQLVPDPLGT